MLTTFIRRQLIAFGILTVISLLVLGVYYLQVPSLMGIGRYELKAELPASGGLYKTANVTLRGITIGKVTDIQPTESGAVATMSIDSRYKVPIDAVPQVHSVSAVGEQYLDLVSDGNPGKYVQPDRTIPAMGTVPAEIGPALDT
ncbi:MAG TPA: MlaD family protein, partial [Mycobacterium sp.]|nr:MlaD family protein [Mycobacterium sp.]